MSVRAGRQTDGEPCGAAPAVDDPLPEAQDLSACLEQYGVDARTRSALRAFSRFGESPAVEHSRAGALLERLPPAPEADRNLHERFLCLFAALPDRDLDVDWLRELARNWRELRRSGCGDDLPQHALRHVVAHSLEALARGRDSYSRLDAEIALAVAAAGLFVCRVLDLATRDDAQPGASPGEATLVEGGWRELVGLAAPVLGLNAGQVVGLLTGHIESGAAALALEDEGRANLVLARALARLRAVLRPRDILCRTGHSSFAVVMPGLAGPVQVVLAANKLLRSFEVPVKVAGHTLQLRLQLGGACAPEHGNDAAALVRRARLALAEAQRRGERIQMFDEALLHQAEDRAALEQEFIAALDSGALALHFQPQTDIGSGRCVGAEALLRWRDATGREVPPPEILEVAGRLGMTAELTRWTVHHACRCLGEMQRSGIDIRLSVNLDTSDIGDPELPLTIRNAAELWHVGPQSLVFEVTEGAMLANETVGAAVLKTLRELGAATSIDDFGTGYSSVIYLRKLPLDELKLDKAFVGRMVHSEQDREIVRSLIQLAHSLKLEVVAEGVEDETTLRLLGEFGCDRAQGFHIGRPQPLERFMQWCRARAGADLSLRASPAGSAAGPAAPVARPAS